MKIAFFVYMFPLPSETFILNQITGLIDRGHDVDIYAIEQGNLQTVHTEVKLYGLMEQTRYLHRDMPRNYLLRMLKAASLVVQNRGWRRPMVWVRALNIFQYRQQAWSLRLMYDAIPLLNKSSYDVIHCQFGSLGPRVLRLKDIDAITGKLVTSFHGADITRYLKNRPGAYDELFKKGDLFLPISRTFRQCLINAGCDEKKIRVLHTGIDCNKFKYVEPCQGEDEPTKLLTIARLVEKKGIAYAIQSIARLIYTGRNILYNVIGDGVLYDDLKNLIKDLGVNVQVHLLGWKSQDEVMSLLQQSHLLIAPSVTAADGDQEGIPVSVKEAMASGLPVISTDHSGIPEIIEDGVSGFLVPERNVDALTARLADLIDHPERWPEIGRAARLRAETEFDINKLNNQLVTLYTQN